MKRQLPDELQFLTLRNAPQKTSSVILSGKTIVLTGATSGVGLATLKHLAPMPNRIFIIVRDPAKAAAALATMENRIAEVILIRADMSLMSQVRRAASEILLQTETIDILINCAGLHSTKRTETAEGFETVFAVNHLAAFLLTQLLTPALLKAKQGRILQINSEGHRFNGFDLNDLDWKKRHYTGLRGYGASKTAQLLCMIEMAKRFEGTGVTINAMHPGDVKTAIGQNNGILYRLFSKLVIQRMLKDPKISSDAIYYLIAEPSLSEVSGKYFYLTVETPPSPHARNVQMAPLIYQKSLELCGLKE